MKRFIRSFFLFLLFTFAFYAIMVFLWGNLMPQSLKPNLNYRLGTYGHMYTRLAEVKTVQDVDVLVIGSSHAYRGIDPRYFKRENITLFNLGSSSQTPLQSRVLLKRYLKQLNPELIIFEVYPGTFSNDGVESSVDLIANEKNDLHTLSMTFAINHIKVYNTFLLGSIRDLLRMNDGYSEPRVKGEDTYIPGGYVEKRERHFRHEIHPASEWQFVKKQFRIFSRTIQDLSQKDINFILVNAPITSSLYDSYSNNSLFDSIMKQHGRYYNFNEMMQLDDSLHFYDSHHLNQEGVLLFNQKIISLLREEQGFLSMNTDKQAQEDKH